MVTYTLEFELATQDGIGANAYSFWYVWCNGSFLGEASSPDPPINTAPGPPGTWTYDDPIFWRLNTFPLPTFDPAINNHIEMGYVGGMDYGHIRRVRVVGSDGSVYYGEYPLGFAYTKLIYDLSYTSWAICDHYGVDHNYGPWLGGDGDYPPYQWDMQLLQNIPNPVDPDGVNTGHCHFYFTVPEGPTRAPQLRWRQRDDSGYGFLRGRRVDNEPSSRQDSLRQGWKSTYL